MNVSDAIRSKRAIREFTGQPVSEEDLAAILNAGRRAQSSNNSQPWRFVVITNRDTLTRLSECGNYARHLAGAAFAVALVGTAHEVDFDLGQAAAYMQLAAWERGIGSCIASMWQPDKARAILGVPEEYSLDIAISFGYPATPPVPKQGAKGRRTFDEVVRREKW
jgi:nitroreductase